MVPRLASNEQKWLASFHAPRYKYVDISTVVSEVRWHAYRLREIGRRISSHRGAIPSK
jgi:hypothetical protein